MFTAHWSKLSIITFEDESNFILEKWNEVEAEKFGFLVNSILKKLVHQPKIGVFINKLNIYSLVISKQTKLYYRINEEESKIELILFWNNKQNPKLLDKILK